LPSPTGRAPREHRVESTTSGSRVQQFPTRENDVEKFHEKEKQVECSQGRNSSIVLLGRSVGMEHDARSATGCASYRQAASRRAFLKVGAVGAFGLSLPHSLAGRAAASTTVARAKSVLLLYTMGGISHHDSFDPKPDAPAEVRGEFRTISTCVPG